ncbi:hypothetical protein SAMN05428988_4109 [Chitinophaga sp. YR573]|uniref:hypothetical protein n=1 Tax=Chitinophaga sp. YR573 TaxID=1881040 RepID=UPI0008CF85FB|nr:hypothetical protein [Chitinophaga sp. YR573]SEW34327.1 hypothetical protein SAMN05428988_4109 [Chitinophaga sp. YR573]
MIPIFEQGQGEGIGHSFDTFLTRFIAICEEHLKNGRAKAFAFILYDFHDSAIKQVLRSQGGFARLDRLAGHDLSVFYLHSDNKRQLNAFNDIFLHMFDILPAQNLPFVLFFKLVDRDAVDVEIAELEQSNIMFAFDELYQKMEDYIDKLKNDDTKNDHRSSKFLCLYQFVKKIAAEKFIEYLVTKLGEYAGRNLI